MVIVDYIVKISQIKLVDIIGESEDVTCDAIIFRLYMQMSVFV